MNPDYNLDIERQSRTDWGLVAAFQQSAILASLPQNSRRPAEKAETGGDGCESFVQFGSPYHFLHFASLAIDLSLRRNRPSRKWFIPLGPGAMEPHKASMSSRRHLMESSGSAASEALLLRWPEIPSIQSEPRFAITLGFKCRVPVRLKVWRVVGFPVPRTCCTHSRWGSAFLRPRSRRGFAHFRSPATGLERDALGCFEPKTSRSNES